MGGYAVGTALDDYILGLARGSRVCFVPTAAADQADAIVAFYQAFGRRAEATHLRFHPWPPEGLREFVLSQDVIYVSGGNTANALAIWRVHGFDSLLREAWESGIVLCGWSAGMICWFEAGVTDSFGPHLEGMKNGLGFLAGSACPHYDGEERRRPVYRELVANGFPPGYAADDAAAVHFVGADLAECVSIQDGSRAYRVERDGETALDVRFL